MPLIFLKQPFIRHYAGTVFELEVCFQQERDHVLLYDRLPPRKMYSLPDDGKGEPALLDAQDVEHCLPSFFETVDICHGPLRVTSIQSYKPSTGSLDLLPEMNPETIILTSVSNVPKQAIQLPEFIAQKCLTKGFLRNKNTPVDAMRSGLSVVDSVVSMEFFPPGFYEMVLPFDAEQGYVLHVIKLFPFGVERDLVSGQFSLFRSLW